MLPEIVVLPEVRLADLFECQIEFCWGEVVCCHSNPEVVRENFPVATDRAQSVAECGVDSATGKRVPVDLVVDVVDGKLSKPYSRVR